MDHVEFVGWNIEPLAVDSIQPIVSHSEIYEPEQKQQQIHERAPGKDGTNRLQRHCVSFVFSSPTGRLAARHGCRPAGL
jgi:hypothetical protein